MIAQSEPHTIVWSRVWRMITGLRPFGRLGNAVVNLTIFAAFVLVGFADLLVSANERDLPFAPGLTWFALLGYGLHIGGGLLNRGWRELPVTTRERRAAAWLLISGVPLLLALAVSAASLVIAVLSHHAGLAGPSLGVFTLRALVVESYALVAITLGNWPGTMDHYWQITQRQARDWLMVGTMIAIMIAATSYGNAVIKMGWTAWPLTLVVVVATGMLLPLAQRVIRLDRPVAPSGLIGTLADRTGWLPIIRWSGWRGHFGRITLRTLVIWTLAMAYFGAVVAFVGAHHARSAASSAYNRGFAIGATFGASSALWVMPAVVGGFIAMISQQYMLRGRLMLLSLPGGDRLVLATPAYSLAIAFAATLLIESPWLGREHDLVLHLIAAAAVALAAVQGLLALNLGVVSYAGLMRNALVFAPIGGLVGFIAAMAQDGKVAWLQVFAQAWFWPALTVGALVCAAGATWLCRWQLDAGRNPYRPWPGAGGGWRGA
jgi:hypothetical protein